MGIGLQSLSKQNNDGLNFYRIPEEISILLINKIQNNSINSNSLRTILHYYYYNPYFINKIVSLLNLNIVSNHLLVNHYIEKLTQWNFTKPKNPIRF